MADENDPIHMADEEVDQANKEISEAQADDTANGVDKTDEVEDTSHLEGTEQASE